MYHEIASTRWVRKINIKSEAKLTAGARCTIFKNLQVTKYKLQVISY
jgi:hypothetical protein